ncbi:Acetyl-CoA:oxalate CoA-transferase [Sodalis praecaptivus]|nr:Acetyl-CoA:oxalate CoA-transferase [Sodalis praecaptivus]
MQVTGWEDGAPTRVGDAIGDVVAGLYGAWGILAALLQRGMSGRGQHIDVAMLDTMMALQMVSLTQWMGGKPSAGRIGNAHPISAPMDSYRAQDGHVVIAVANDRLFLRLAQALDREALTRDPRFITDPQRLAHQAPLREVIEDWLSDKTVAEAVALLDAAGVPDAPVWTLDQALASPHAAARQLLKPVKHPTAGEIAMFTQPVKMSGMTPPEDIVPPVLGQHTRQILSQALHLDAQTLDELQQRGVIG